MESTTNHGLDFRQRVLEALSGFLCASHFVIPKSPFGSTILDQRGFASTEIRIWAHCVRHDISEHALKSSAELLMVFIAIQDPRDAKFKDINKQMAGCIVLLCCVARQEI
ncbi:uncharacterized protein BT62DRAFT_937923 [Guyanagaster necrorhizus]|uniref:Uncharacterized protein n=1 Tax=Guyanagaster necrorhizus TaxID=856835 RepID=A0A9P8AMA2_9AGAR|nr:uncharacterized protein BT62DRAFT_937923 [Guyanagaster necrorhizus MCA 3950]KAG7440524.1 hypothetical protein BT62DRAFT_937923 [Guyanagaster necrorhizus MCA 3950]